MNNDNLNFGEDEIQIISFKLGNEEYAVPITSVQEIIMLQNSTRIPKSPIFVEGVINLRGHIIPVIDGRKKFQLELDEERDPIEARIMILEINGEISGLIVDAVTEVVHLKKEDIEPPPIEKDDESNFLMGIGKYNDRLLILVNHEKFLDFSEVQDLTRISNVTQAIKQAKDLIAG